jgi:hypothetical protein
MSVPNVEDLTMAVTYVQADSNTGVGGNLSLSPGFIFFNCLLIDCF